MKHLGDIAGMNGANIPFVDVITGGSPCQDLSIAGKRAGLAGARSGLFMEQIRVIKEMREASGTAYPRYMVWENVPGAFSSNKGKDFAAVLEETIHIVEPEAPSIEVPEKGWPTWGCYRDMDGQWSVAWRTLDAQYWGVPQRRRRIALVADFGGGSAPEILFERKGVYWDSETSGEARERTSEGTERSSFAASYALRIRGGCEGGGKEPLVQVEKSGTLGTGNDQTIFAFSAGQGAKAGGIGYQEEIAPSLKAAESGTNRTPCVVLPINDKATRYQGGGDTRKNDGAGNGLGIGKDGDPSPTLTSGDYHGVAVLTFDTTQITSPQNGNKPKYGDPCHPLYAGAHPLAIACKPELQAYSFDSLASNSMKSRNPHSGCRPVDVAKTLDTSYPDPSKNQGGIAIVQTYQETTGTLSPGAHAGSYNGQDAYNDMLVCHSLRSKSNCAFRENMETYPITEGFVRRLTPLECERLQGFTDGWTDIGEWYDEKGKKHKPADSPRYKALGNSIALPPWRFVLSRIYANLPHGASLGSLFDGIGGFPLIWRELGGTPVWASEIEGFTIAVTKKRFGGA